MKRIGPLKLLNRRATVYCFSGVAELLTVWACRKTTGDPQRGRHVALVYGLSISLPPSLVALLRDLLARLRLFNKVVFLNEKLDFDAIVDPESDWSGHVQAVRDALRWIDVREIWLHNIWNRPEKLFLDAFPEARVGLYDNGLVSHVAQPIVAKVEGRVVTTRGVYSADLSRVDRVFLTFRDELGVPAHLQGLRVETLEPETVRAVLRDFDRLAQPRIDPDLRNAQHRRGLALLIGTSFNRTGHIGFDEEVAVYVECAKRLADEGFGIVWKEHPRSHRPLGPEVRRALSGQLIDVDLPQGLPIEVLCLHVPIRFAASISSSALLALRKYFSCDVELLSSEATAGVRGKLHHVQLLVGALERHEAPEGRAAAP